MMKLLIVVVLALFLITSCVPVQESPEIVEGTAVDEIDPEEEVTPEETAEPQTVPEEAMKGPVKDLEIAELVEKSSKLDNYQYLYQKTTSIASTGYKVFYLQGKVMKEYSSPKKASNELSYNKVYLDMDEKTAFAVCDTSSIACKGYRLKIYTINYAAEELPFLAHKLPMKITADAVKEGNELVESRKTLLVKYDNTKINLDKFSGIAVKYAVEGSEESHSFSQLGLNSVKLEDVTLPDGYELVE